MSELALFPSTPEIRPASTSIELHRQLDDLHQMIYRRGGVRPVNAAIEELTKLLLLELAVADDPAITVPGFGLLSDVLDPDAVAAAEGISAVKAAFRHVASLPMYAGRLPDGGAQPIWPDDEPLRLSRADVIAQALRLLRGQLQSDRADAFDVIGTAFDIFLRGRYDHSGGLGTHLTPHTVATMLAEVCVTDLSALGEPYGTPIIGDPCCGTGRFLIAAINALGLDPDDPKRAALLERGIFGADQSSSSVAKTRINLLLLGARHPNVFTVEDSLVDAHLDTLRGQVRLILTNPPFGDGKYDSDEGIRRSASLLPGLAGKHRIDPALGFVTRCIEMLDDGGRLGIVLPDGLVDGPVLRQALLGTGAARVRDVSVEANISLPTATFALAGTVARTSALIIRKQAARRSHVFLARAEHVGYLKQGSSSVPDPQGDDLPAITRSANKAFSTHITGAGVRFLSRAPLAAVVPADELTTLDPARVDPDAVEARQALRGVGAPFRDRLVAMKRRQRAATGSLPFISVLHIDDLGAIAWHEARSYAPTTPGLEAHPGELIVSLLNPRKLRASVIPDDGGPVLCSSEFGVFRPLGDPYEVLVLLHHPHARAQLAPLGRGTSSSRRRISPDDLLDVLAPAIAAKHLAAQAAALHAALDALRSASVAAADAYAAVGSAGLDATDA
ncbi:MAG TPA: N-6 DNA methylase [Solirubrobacteraceae bacterium]|nr:N-6 DNA methylase [Solirubrobacteraceae bacterium]